MSTLTFQINDASTGGTFPAVWVSITEAGDGALSFSVWQEGGIIGDLRGLFFDVADESILKTLIVSASSQDIRIGDDSVKDLGDGANMNGLTGTDKGYDVGIEIGTAGIGKDDIQSYSFTLSSTARDLSLDDLAHVDFAARLTSVGVVAGTRTDSSKILENTSEAIHLEDAQVCAEENTSAAGNLLGNINLAGTTAITGWTGADAGAAVALSSEGDIIGTLTLNADGSYVLDASIADRLSAGEHIEFEFSYSARNQDEATSWSTDDATFTVCVTGTNDGPDANDDDAGCIVESEALTGDVTGNDSDIDRLDTHTYALVQDSFGGLGSLTMNEDGTWSYAADGAYDHLNEGEHVELSFQYSMTDNHGASDTATVTFCVMGTGNDSGDGDGDGDDTANDFPVWAQDISHFTLVFDNGGAGDTDPRGPNQPPGPDGYYTVKIDVSGDFDDDLDVSIEQILAQLAENNAYIDEDSDLLGVVIKGGLQDTQYFAYGEHNDNGAAADALPEGIGFDLYGNESESPTYAIDASYDFDVLMS